MRAHRKVQFNLALTGFLILSGASSALAECHLSGHIEAAMSNDHPELGLWQYTLTVTWDTGSKHLSHLNLWLDETDQNCTCQEIGASLAWEYPAGSSTGAPADCPLDYEAFLECNGDPSLDIDGIIIKFEPIEENGCEPGAKGRATAVFYSDYFPASISLPNLFLTDKFGRMSCYGQVTGVFPGLPCDPTPARPVSWGQLKAIYDR
jgi:hypothetical protein